MGRQRAAGIALVRVMTPGRAAQSYAHVDFMTPVGNKSADDFRGSDDSDDLDDLDDGDLDLTASAVHGQTLSARGHLRHQGPIRH
jgi:hypothetical protein